MAETEMALDICDEHRWLSRLAGEWEYEGRMIPDQPEFRASGTETVRMLGEVWMLAEAKGTMADGSETSSLIAVGFDPGTGRFTGSFMASMMTGLWLYDGALDATGARCGCKARDRGSTASQARRSTRTRSRSSATTSAG